MSRGEAFFARGSENSMGDFLNNMRKKPLAHRRAIALFAAASFSVVIIGLWVLLGNISAALHAGELRAPDDDSPWESIRELIGGARRVAEEVPGPAEWRAAAEPPEELFSPENSSPEFPKKRAPAHEATPPQATGTDRQIPKNMVE